MIRNIIIYTKRVDEMVAFYERFFGFTAHCLEGDRIVELRPSDGGASLLLHPMGDSRKEGQVLVKLVFTVPDVDIERERLAALGLQFGPSHRGDDYEFANAKDPSGNSISISSRGAGTWK